MPLAFPSLDHGTVAFGFFNIACDMLLLENRFFFAHHFCRAAETVAPGGTGEAEVDGWLIDEPSSVGNLHGAIAGRDHHGFLGASYRAFPFPAAPEDFKQWPDGAKNRETFRSLIEPFARSRTFAVTRDTEGRRISVDAFAFDGNTFRRLVAYVEQGGYPRWRDEERPPYVLTAARAWGIASPGVEV